MRLGHKLKLPDLMASIHLDLTRNPAEAWMYRTRDSTLGKTHTFRAVRVEFHLVGADG